MARRPTSLSCSLRLLPARLPAPPEFVEVAVVTSVEHVMRAFGCDEVGGGVTSGRWGCGKNRKVIVADDTGSPRQVVQVAVAATVDHVVRGVSGNEVSGGVTHRCRCVRHGGEVVVADRAGRPV